MADEYQVGHSYGLLRGTHCIDCNPEGVGDEALCKHCSFERWWLARLRRLIGLPVRAKEVGA